MTRRFSPQELAFLRNEIPIEHVIVSFLSLQHRRDSDKLRFACPLCGGFDTSIQLKTNLARCFACKRNFNPIEMVMAHLRLGFAQSASWLKERNVQRVNQTPAAYRKNQASPAKIGDILSAMLSSTPQPSAEPPTFTIPERIASLEKKVEELFTLIEELTSLRSPRQ
jgi:hypothetical protein